MNAASLLVGVMFAGNVAVAVANALLASQNARDAQTNLDNAKTNVRNAKANVAIYDEITNGGAS